MASIKRKKSTIKESIERSQEYTALLLELENIAELENAYGVIRHHIVKQRPVMRYELGEQHPTEMMEVVTKDGHYNIVPAYLLETA